MPSLSLSERYNAAASTPSDIYYHVPKLRELAATCKHVTEFGVRYGVSTVALLAAQPEVLISYDVRYCPIVEELAQVAGKCRFKFVLADTKFVTIEITDMLFIDTLHVGGQLRIELMQASQVRGYIAMHDTTTFGQMGEGGWDGLQWVIDEFLANHPEWVVAYKTTENNGLTVLERR